MWTHGGDILTVKQYSGKADLIDFSANINPLGQPLSVKNAIMNSVEPSLGYPDPFCRELKQSIAEFENINKNYIVCGNGAAEIIFKIAYGLKPKSVLIPAPTFAEYEQAVRQTGANVNYFYLDEVNEFRLSDEIIPFVKCNDILFICSPNNPVGNSIDLELVRNILAVGAENGTTVVMDECFMDLTENDSSAKSLVEDYKNLIIIKAFTKSFGIPGIRLGYCICSDENMLSVLEKTGPPWSVSVPAQLSGIAACGEREFLRKSVKYICAERVFISNKIRELGLEVFESETNFILFKCHDLDLRDKLIQKGIVIRDCSNYEGLCCGFYRIAVRTHEENCRLIDSLREVL